MGNYRKPIGIWLAAQRTQVDWQNAQVKALHVQQQGREKWWRKPSANWEKINTDVATNVGGSNTGVAFVVQDDQCGLIPISYFL